MSRNQLSMRQQRLIDRFRASSPQVSVGVLTADWMNIGSQLQSLERAGVKLLHFDVMDGCFCPMLTMGAPIVAGMKTSLLKDVHLMVDEPLDKIESFAAAGADLITIHAESTRHPHRVLQALGTMTNVNDPERGIVRGVALNPGTPLETLDPLLDEIEMASVLAVNPGWGGQKLITSTRDRLARVQEKLGHRVLIAIDGGITRENVVEVARWGADIIVTRSAVFDGRSAEDNARYMVGALQ